MGPSLSAINFFTPKNFRGFTKGIMELFTAMGYSKKCRLKKTTAEHFSRDSTKPKTWKSEKILFTNRCKREEIPHLLRPQDHMQVSSAYIKTITFFSMM